MSDVIIILGSDSDMNIADRAREILDFFDITYSVEIASAHRNPQKVARIVSEGTAGDTKVFIAIAGLAAHLPGVVASQTTRPVIGVPVNAAMDGLDALLSIAQMPKGVPVACVGIGRGDNAAILAAQIIALSDDAIAQKLSEHKAKMSNA